MWYQSKAGYIYKVQKNRKNGWFDYLILAFILVIAIVGVLS